MSYATWSADMLEHWKQAQHLYWKSLSGQAAPGQNDAERPVPDLAEGMERWHEFFNSTFPGAPEDMMQRLSDAGKVYSQFLGNTLAQADSAQMFESWFETMEKIFKEVLLNTGNNENHFAPFAMGMNMLQNWHQILSNLDNIPEDQLKPAAAVAQRYQEALKAYTDAYSMHGLDSLQALRERMETMAKEGSSVDSMRELYEIWIDVSEETYQKFVAGNQYQELYGELINAFVVLKGNMQTLLEPQLKALNIPTQAELNKVMQQVQTLRNENAELREQSSKLTRRIAELESAVNQNSDSGQGAGADNSVDPEVIQIETAADDLTEIKGVGPKMGEKLIDAGIQSFDQLAALSAEQIIELDTKLDARGRVLRDNWAGQAAEFSNTRLA